MSKEHVSYAEKRVYIGIDVHRAFFVASCVCEGVVVKRCRMPSKSAAVMALITKYFPGSIVMTCYEAGYSGFWLHRELTSAGISNIVVHAAHVEIESNRVKTDKRDSQKLAEQLFAGRLRGIRVPSPEEEDLRLLTRTREQTVRKRRRVQVQIRMRLHQFGLVPETITGVLRPQHVVALLKDIQAHALKATLELLLDEWLYLAAKVKALDKKLLEQAAKDPLDAIYRSVPGIGPLIARILSFELGDMSQFANERALFSFTGLTPGEYSSGDKIRRGTISRQGSSRLRYILVEAAWKAIRKDTVLREFYERVGARRGKKRAIVAVARKLIGRIRAAFKANKNYEIDYKKAA